MTDRILNWLEKLRKRVGGKTYNITLALFTIGLTIIAAFFGGIHIPALLGLFAAIFNHVAIFFLIFFTFQYFNGGAELDVQKKIYEEGNMAAAIYQAAIVLALAILIGGAI